MNYENGYVRSFLDVHMFEEKEAVADREDGGSDLSFISWK